MSQTQNKKVMVRGFICALMGGVCWGFSGACGQYLLTDYQADSMWLTVVRMVFAGIALMAWAIISQRDKLVGILQNKKDLIDLIVFAIVGLLFDQYAYMVAIEYTNAGTATVLQYLGPVLIMAFVCLKALRLPRPREALAIVCALGGVFLLATGGSFEAMQLSEEGLLWGILAALGLAFYTVLPVRIVPRWGSVVVTGYGMLIGGIALAIYCRAWDYQISLDMAGYLAIASIVLIGTVAAFTLYLQGVADVGVVKASMLACIEPVSAAVFAAVWLGTSFTFTDIIGFVLIMLTVFILARKD